MFAYPDVKVARRLNGDGPTAGHPLQLSPQRLESRCDLFVTVLHRMRMNARNPKSLELCTLLYKKPAVQLAVEPRWVGFDAPDEFLVGYGLDHDEDFRQLPYIAALSRESRVEGSSPKEAANGRTRI